MATLICSVDEGVLNYKVHVAFSVSPDPYPSGATVGSYGKTLDNVKNNATVTIKASETTCRSNYTFPVYVYTKTSSSAAWSKVDYLQSGTVTFSAGTGTKYVKVGPATKGSGGGTTTYNTNNIYFRCGDGINSYKMNYDGSTSTSNTSNSITSSVTSTVLAVRSGTNAVLNIYSVASGYVQPIFFREYTDSTFGTVKKTFSEGDLKVYSNGTRYIKLFATKYVPTDYAINLRTGVGVSSYSVSYPTASGTTQTATVSNSAASTVCYVKNGSNLQVTNVNYATNYAAPFRFSEYNSDFSEVLNNFDDNDKYVTSNAVRYLRLKGTYVEPTYKMYFRRGIGVKSFTVYRGSTYVSLNSSLTWSGVDLKESDKTVTIKTIAHEDGYGTPDYVGFYASPTATSPAASAQTSAGEFTITYATNRQYVEVSATKIKTPISLFYWDGNDGSNDTVIVATGKPFSNITAAMWNRLNRKVKEIAEALGGSHSYTTVSSGDTMTATLFNQPRNTILGLSGRGSIPSEKSKGDALMAGHFNGANSIKNGLNVAIQAYNA